MKYTKKLGPIAVAAAALMAFAGSASATELTSPKGTKVPVGTVLKAESAGAVSLTGSITITCQKASGEGEITDAGGPGKRVKGLPTITSISECGNHTVTVVQPGTGELESLGGNTGTGITNGAEVTVLLHGFLIGTIHCIYVSKNTHGTVEGSEYAGSTTARVQGTLSVQREATDGACGEHSTLEGTAILTTPDHLYID